MPNRYGLEKIVLSNVKNANPQWFTRENKRFFNDVSYRLLYGKITGKRYLIRSTYAWSDMFDGVKKLHWRINHINDDLTIGNLTDDIFQSIYDVKAWLKFN